jgi:hypothetical protein
MDFMYRALWLASLAAVTVISCAGGTRIPEDDSVVAATTATASASVGSGGFGGDSSSGGSGGSSTPSACGIDCSTIMTDACHVAECNPDTKNCEIVNRSNGTSCEDGVFCTIDDSCQDGLCTGGGDNDCGLSPAACQDVSCDEANKTCAPSPKAEGASCSSQDLCQVNSTCSNGLCVGITKDCFFSPVPNDCYSAVCNPANGQCEPQVDSLKNGMTCSDPSDLCTVNKICNNGMCEGGSPKDCSFLTQGCQLGTCDTMTGSCTTQSVAPGMMCDDLNSCTVGETCSNGQCNNGTPITQCSGQTADGCCPSTCNDTNDKDCETLGLIFLTSSNGSLGFHRYTIASNSWVTVKSPPVATKSQITNDGQFVYLMGQDGNVYKYAPPTDSWTTHMPGPPKGPSSPIGLFQWFNGGFYYCKDGSSTLFIARNGSWTNLNLPVPCSSAGTWDESTKELYIRRYSQLGFVVLDTQTDLVKRTVSNTTSVGENSRTGSYHSGFFYSRTFTGTLQKLHSVTGVTSDTTLQPGSDHTGSDTDFTKGKIYLSGYSSNSTVFQVFDPVANTLTSLANQPSVSNHSTITVMR